VKANILVAYPYMKKPMIDLLKENEHRTRFLLDSGAFTAWKAGKPIALDDYCRFIESLPFEPWRYFMLDVIGDPKATLKNYETMLKRGFKPIPIFTRGEDPSVLEDYYKTSDVVAIGGLVGTKGNKGFVKGIMEKVGKRRVHWLGFTDLNFVKHYKPYSCDASSWNNGAQFGYVQTIDKRTMTAKTIDNKHFKLLSNLEREKLFSCFHNGGLKINLNKYNGRYGAPMVTGAKTWTQLSIQYEKKIGTIILLAVAADYQAHILLTEFSRYTEAP